MVKAFDTKRYIDTQREKILEKVRQYGNKLYFELGGKLLDDYHATRVLPGFEPDTKMKLLSSLREELELIICINSENIQNDRIRSDYNTLYIDDCIRLIDNYRKLNFLVSGIALTVFKHQTKAIEFAKKLKSMGEKVYFLNYIPEYPNNLDAILESFEENDFIETTKPLVVITSSGSASGKLSACLSQIYKEYKRGNKVGYAKYDIFPVWNLPTNHPLNLAFEAATADSGDKVLIDSFYYDQYKKIVSNYNRDIDVYPIIKKILTITMGEQAYNSPTEMVINTMAEAITDDETICKKGKEEVCRRYLTYYKQFLRGHSSINPILRVKDIMNKNHILIDDLEIVPIARAIFKKYKHSKSLVIEFEDKGIIVVHETDNFSLGANLIRVFLKERMQLELSENLLKSNGFNNSKIDILDILNYINSIEDDKKTQCYKSLQELRGCNAHTSYVISMEEEKQIKSLGINITCEPNLEN